MLLLACSGTTDVDPDTSGEPVRPRLSIGVGAAQSARYATAVPINPTVRVRTPQGPVRDVEVTFEVRAGGGDVERAVVRTDSEGEASPGAWRLGPTPGLNTLVARAVGDSLRITAVAEPGPPSRLVLVRGAGGAATELRVLPESLVVRVLDAADFPVAGAQVGFEVIAGGGALSRSAAPSASDGLASAGLWRLGAAGRNAVRITVPGAPPLEVERVAAPLVVSRFAFISPDAGRGIAGNVSPVLPVVEVRGAAGEPLDDLPVRFRVVDGGGTLAAVEVRSDAVGRASPGGWQLGEQTGVQSIIAELLIAEPPPSVRASVSAEAPGTSAFSITVVPLAPLPAIVTAAIDSARRRWEAVIIGDLPDVVLSASAPRAAIAVDLPRGRRTCVPSLPSSSIERVDDVLLFVDVVPIDGSDASGGSTLATAAAALPREGPTGTMLAGCVFLDSDDLQALQADGRLLDVLTHEMGHALGFGTRWQALGLVADGCTALAAFRGAAAVQAYALARGRADGALPPLDTGGSCGDGNRDRHWRESAFGSELMTSLITRGSNALSALTAAHFTDLGYRVRESAAERLVVGSALRAGLQAAP